MKMLALPCVFSLIFVPLHKCVQAQNLNHPQNQMYVLDIPNNSKKNRSLTLYSMEAGVYRRPIGTDPGKDCLKTKDCYDIGSLFIRKGPGNYRVKPALAEELAGKLRNFSAKINLWNYIEPAETLPTSGRGQKIQPKGNTPLACLLSRNCTQIVP
jgi:hypothetical protein